MGPSASHPRSVDSIAAAGCARVELERGGAELNELLPEDALARAAGDDDAHARSHPDAGRLAQLERRAQDGRGDTPRRLVRVGERVGLRRGRGLFGGRGCRARDRWWRGSPSPWR